MGKPALCGGEPVRSKPWPGWPIWDEREVEALAEVVDLFDILSVDVKTPSLSRGVRDYSACERFIELARRAGKPGALKLVFAASTTD